MLAAAGGDAVAIDAGLLARTALVARLLPGKKPARFAALDGKDVSAFESIVRPNPKAASKLPPALKKKAEAISDRRRAGRARGRRRGRRRTVGLEPRPSRAGPGAQRGQTETAAVILAPEARGGRRRPRLTALVNEGQNRGKISVFSLSSFTFLRVAALTLALLATGTARGADPIDPTRGETGGVSDTDARVAVASALGDRLFKLGRYEEAVAEYRRAYELRADPRFLYHIAESYRELGATEQALFYYERFLAGAPDAPERDEVLDKITELDHPRRHRESRAEADPRSRGDRLEDAPARQAVAQVVVLDRARRGGDRRGDRRDARARFRGRRSRERPRQQEVLLKPSVAMAAISLTLGACHRDGGDAALLIVVTASGSPAAVVALDVTLSGPAGTSPARYTRDDQQPISFPTTLTAVLPARATGDLTVDVHATDATGAVVATGHGGPFPVPSGGRETVYVQLDCGGSPCVVDGGGPGSDGGVPGGGPSCGNGRVDPEETCDTAIARGDPGACPPANPLHPCDDGVACTRDIPSGSGCTAACRHEEITVAATGDDCCPAGSTSDADPDCSATCGNGVVDPRETCDTGIAAGSPGACPAGEDCKSGAPCSGDLLVSAGTCSAICMHYPVTTRSGKTRDDCCPPGATSAVDDDCPAVCGNGVVESKFGEQCDPGIPNPLPGSCPGNCPNQNGCPPGCDDGDPCTTDFIAGTGCQAACVNLLISAQLSGDGCCPPGASHASDSDCPPRCGNGVLEPGEACDKTATGATACPTACPASPSACLHVALVGNADDCSARCVTTTTTVCSAQKDGCCPTGCTAANDADCSPACGDGFLEPTLGEVCDQAVPAGRPGACPTACASGNPCTEARLLGAGTCAATCVLLPITGPRAGDGCCPSGADFSVDTDCVPSCGNGVVESPSESCDYNAGAGTSCPDRVPGRRRLHAGRAPRLRAGLRRDLHGRADRRVRGRRRLLSGGLHGDQRHRLRDHLRRRRGRAGRAMRPGDHHRRSRRLPALVRRPRRLHRRRGLRLGGRLHAQLLAPAHLRLLERRRLLPPGVHRRHRW